MKHFDENSEHELETRATKPLERSVNKLRLDVEWMVMIRFRSENSNRYKTGYSD